jgi:hypothetical protein
MALFDEKELSERNGNEEIKKTRIGSINLFRVRQNCSVEIKRIKTLD